MFWLLLNTYVPYDPASWQKFWNAIMTTIGSASKLGMSIFITLSVIGIFTTVVRIFMKS